MILTVFAHARACVCLPQGETRQDQKGPHLSPESKLNPYCFTQFLNEQLLNPSNKTKQTLSARMNVWKRKEQSKNERVESTSFCADASLA